MDSQTLQQLKDEIKQAINESIHHSNIGKVLEKYGIGDNVIKFEYSLDLTKIQVSDAEESQQVQELMPAISKPEMKLVECNLFWCQTCCVGGCWACM
ncbi:MAG: hypothetical protein KME32_20435 [Mojavia pulchra JT2-VF2]|uniref:Uncharacterized protein n=1 Tax=Mojavia pulchra JT2-VF2 TaxID=287848 RepID=A0A951UIL4_9NOST|nr:hypothetical protein [Mojavia pulchra JT2-VF2]